MLSYCSLYLLIWQICTRVLGQGEATTWLLASLRTTHGKAASFDLTRVQTLVIPRTCVTSVDGKLRSGQYLLKRVVPTIRQISTNDKLLSNVGLRVVGTRLFGCRESCSCYVDSLPTRAWRFLLGGAWKLTALHRPLYQRWKYLRFLPVPKGC